MFKTMLQLAMLAAVIGVAKSSYDNGAFTGIDFQPVTSMIQKAADMMKSFGVPGGQDASEGAGAAINAINNLNIAKQHDDGQKGAQNASEAVQSGARDVPHAFYRSTPEKCPGELTIDLQSGVATCRSAGGK